MSPTFNTGDYLLAYKTKNIKRGDVIFFNTQHSTMDMLKRCVAISGDTLLIRNDTLFVNGKAPRWINVRKLKQYFTDNSFSIPLWQPTPTKKKWTVSDYGEIVIPYNESTTLYFVLGDNRLNSLDSRYFGYVKSSDILGKIIFSIKW